MFTYRLCECSHKVRVHRNVNFTYAGTDFQDHEQVRFCKTHGILLVMEKWWPWLRCAWWLYFSVLRAFRSLFSCLSLRSSFFRKGRVVRRVVVVALFFLPCFLRCFFGKSKKSAVCTFYVVFLLSSLKTRST